MSFPGIDTLAISAIIGFILWGLGITDKRI